jgi:hypothetical protein
MEARALCLCRRWRLAVQFEIAPVWFQLRAEGADVTGGAGLAGLDGKRRQRKRATATERGEEQDQHSRATAREPNARGQRVYPVQSASRSRLPNECATTSHDG